MHEDSWFIMTGDERVFNALLALGFVEYEHEDDSVYILLNRKDKDVPEEYLSKCIFSSAVFLNLKGGESGERRSKNAR